MLNGVLRWIGVIEKPLIILNTDIAVYIGIVYSYLPFMVLPLYANLVRMDRSLLEAAADLGCRPAGAFWKITVPLARPGIVAGCFLVFIPAVGEFVIPDLLGGSGTLMIGRILWTEFFRNRDWPVASAVAVILLLVLIVPIVLFPAPPAAPARGGGLMRRGLSGINLAALTLGFAFLYIPILLLIIFSFNESKLVTVWAGFSTKWYAAMVENELLLDAAWMTLKVARRLVNRGAGARHPRGARAGPARALPRPHALLRDGLRAAGHARGHHRPLDAAALRGTLLGARLLDRDDRPHHLLHGVRGGGGAVPAAHHGPFAGGSGDGPGRAAGQDLLRRPRCRSSARR